MAQYSIAHACGHNQTHSLFGPSKDRTRKQAWLETTICTDCYRYQQDAERASETEAALLLQSEFDLPSLEGTEKQVAWAVRIRQAWILGTILDTENRSTLFPQFLRGDSSPQSSALFTSHQDWLKSQPGMSRERLHSECIPAAYDALVPSLYTWAASYTESSWWIDHRNFLADVAATALQVHAWVALKAVVTGQDAGQSVSQAEASAKAQKEASEQSLREEMDTARLAREEAILRPATPASPLLAEFTVKEHEVIVTFPERHDVVRGVLRSLDYHWTTHWARQTSIPQDLATETAHRLLLSGIGVVLYDHSLRCRAVAGDYKPINRPRVATFIQGDYKGCFCIAWPHEADFYRETMRLHGARYAKPYVAVPAENWAEVEDFASTHHFEITASAQKMMERGKVQDDPSLGITPAPLPSLVLAATPPGLPTALDAPIPSHLMDDENSSDEKSTLGQEEAG
jgi:hypothetical protein